VTRKWGLKGLSLGDQRDALYAYRYLGKAVKGEIPTVKYNICAPVRDQLTIGSCGPFSAAMHLTATQVFQYEEPVSYSPLFLYYAYRKRFGHVENDDGVMLRDMLKVLATDGICRESTWPYKLENFSVEPPPAAWEEAKTNRIKSYHALYTLDDMIDCLAEGYGFLGGIGCYESILDAEKTGIIALPKLGEKLLGWHALFFGGGYDNHKHMIKAQNSWGDWGDEGYAWLPYEYMSRPGLAADFWTIR
jgi:C1A family cysteine protease